MWTPILHHFELKLQTMKRFPIQTETRPHLVLGQPNPPSWSNWPPPIHSLVLPLTYRPTPLLCENIYPVPIEGGSTVITNGGMLEKP